MNSRGFTLVEMMVVVTLVMILSMMAVSGYVAYRKSVVVALSADDLVSQINELRTRAFYGKFDGVRRELILGGIDDGDDGESFLDDRDVDSFCYGVLFEKVDGEFAVKAFSQIFSRVKVWRDGKGFEYVGCGDVDGVEANGLKLDEGVVIVGEDVESFFLRFVPPNGMMESDLDNSVDLEVQYRNDEGGRGNRRVLHIDLINEKVVVK